MNARTIGVALLLVTVAGPACAAPEVIEMKNRIRFRHRAHMTYTGTCKACHLDGIGKIPGFGKEWAHRNCRGCHKELNRGPNRCSECHKWAD
jgi:cytochrome c5